MNPLLLAWNCMPRLTEPVSASSMAPDGAPFCQTLQGHCGPGVVKLQMKGLPMGVPFVFWAPDTVAVYVVLDARELVGVKVATVLAPLKVREPATGFPVESWSVKDTVAGCTATEKVAVGATDTATPVAP